MRRPLLALFSLFLACGPEVTERDTKTATPPRTIEAEADTGGDADGAAQGTFTGNVGLAPTSSGGLSATVLPAATGRGVVLDVILGAKSTLDAGLYQVTDAAMTQALVDAKGRGVAVRVVIDDSEQTASANASAVQTLTSKGIDVVKASGFVYHHAKYMIVDGSSAVVMTCNFSSSSFTSNREVVVKVTNSAQVAELSTIFAADFAHTTPELSPGTSLVVAPVNARAKLVALIGNAKARVIVAMQSVSDNETVALLIARHDAGVDVRVLMADPHRYGEYGESATLKAHGVDVRYMPESIYYLHEKVIIADTSAFVGSVNLTFNSITNNREIGVIGDASFTDLVLPQVEADWDAGVSF